MRKIINAEGQDFEPVSTDDLVLDAVPTVNSFNSVTSDAVARAVAGASGEVPQVTQSDNGKVLTAIYDEGGPAVEWGTVPSELPDTTGASQGDVLAIGSSGLEWATPAAGDGFSPTLVAQQLGANKNTLNASFDGASLTTPGLMGVPVTVDTIGAGWYAATLDCTTEGSYTWATGVPKTFNFEFVVPGEEYPSIKAGHVMPVSFNGEGFTSEGTILFYLTGEQELHYFKARVSAPADANFTNMYLTVKLYKL